MNRLESFRFGNRRRRKLFVVLLTLLLVVTLSFIILILLGLFGFRAELVSVSLTDQRQNVTYNGVGINLDHIPNVNLISNPSFEKETQYYSLTVLDCDGQSLFFAPEDVIASGINTARSVGAHIRVVSIDAEGNMQLRYEGYIDGYESTSLGQKTEVTLPESVKGNSRIIKTCTLQNTVTALTDSGIVLTDITSEQLVKLYDGGNLRFVDICGNGSSIFAVTADGVIYNSADGKTFLEMAVSEDNEEITMDSCAVTSDVLTLLSTSGDIYVYESGFYNKIGIPSYQGVDMIGATDDTTVIILSDGSVMRSGNGLVYSYVDTGDIYSERKAVSLTCSKGKAYLLNDDGTITVIDVAGNGGAVLLDAAAGADISVSSFVVTDNGQIIVATKDKTAVMISQTAGDVHKISSDNISVDGIFAASNGKLMIESGDKLYSASVLSDFSLMNTAPDDAITLGDICFVDMSNSYISLSADDGDKWYQSPEDGLWDIYGNGTGIELSSQHYDGNNSLRMTGITDNAHIASQKLSGSIRDNFAPDTFYKLSLYLKADASSMTPGQVEIWLSGKSFGNQGMTVTNIRSEYTEYSTVFVVNDKMMSDDSVRLNISFTGAGTILVDQIYVGPDSLGKADIPGSFYDGIKEGRPSAVRLNNLGIGSNGYSDSVFWGVNELSTGARYKDDKGESHRLSDVRSFEKSLKLVRDADADPWLVLGSYTTPEQVNNIVSYLCGSVSSEYGSLRINNGTALPWSRQFDKVYFEISDSEGIFTSDVQRSSFVDYVIGMITQSEFYTDIKDKIIFLDGMSYDGGMMMSSADAHTSRMRISSVPENDEEMRMTYLERVTEAFEKTRNSAPRVASGRDLGEFIGSVDFAGEFNFAQYMAALMGDSSYFAELTLIDCDISFRHSLYNGDDVFAKGSEMRKALTMMSLVSDIAGTRRMYANVADPMSNKSGQTAEGFLKQCSVSQFDSDTDSYLVITNTSDNLCQFVMFNASRSFDRSEICRYSSDGGKLSTKTLTNSYRRYNLQPGETIIVTLYR